MKCVDSLFLILPIAIFLSFFNCQSIESTIRPGVLNLLNQTGSILEIHTEELKVRPEGGWEVIKHTELIQKGQNYALPLDKIEKANLSYQTTYSILGKKLVPLPLKKIVEEARGRVATLVLTPGGWTGSDIVIDLDKNLKVADYPQEIAEEGQLQELIIRNDAIMNIFVRYHTEFDLVPQTYKGKPVPKPEKPIEGMTTTWIRENQDSKISLISRTPLKTLKVTKIEVAPAYASEEENRAHRDTATGWTELPLERIKRMAGNHTEAMVPITRESGLLGKTLIVDLHGVEFR